MTPLAHYFTLWMLSSWVIFAALVFRIVKGKDAPPGIAFPTAFVAVVLGAIATFGWYVVDLLR